MKFSEQIKNNSLALVSLFVAFTALAYNTWRNEESEANRNVRQSGFEMIIHIGELQKITYIAQYDMDKQRGNPRAGWTEVLLLRDLSKLVSEETQQRAEQLLKIWKNNWQNLGDDNEFSVAEIDIALNNLRKQVLNTMSQLE